LTSSANQNTQQIPSNTVVDEFEKINANCSDKLQKFSEVKPNRKRGNFNKFRGRKKFQLNNNWNYHRNYASLDRRFILVKFYRIRLASIDFYL
jgi:hypothetical protein